MKKSNASLHPVEGKKRNTMNSIRTLFIFSVLFFTINGSFAHCDTMEGPVIRDAQKAINQNNVNIVLKWVQAADEAEIRTVFNQIMKVRGISADVKNIAEKYFFDTLVRIHRAGEGIAFTGVKPAGTPVDQKILAADRSIEVGNLSPLNGIVPKDDLPELTKRFDKVMSLKNFDVNNVKEGREYIEAYVQFFKFAEGEHDGHEKHNPAHNH